MSDLEQFPSKDMALILAYYVKKILHVQGRMAVSGQIYAEPSPGKKIRREMIYSAP